MGKIDPKRAKHIRFNINAKIGWLVSNIPETGQWMAVCDPLGVCLHGDTYEELQSIIAEALDALFRDLIKTGELDSFLRERGWSVTTEIDPVQINSPNVRLDIPWAIEPQSYRDLQATAC